MKASKIFTALLLVDFVALNIWAFATSGVSGLLEFITTMGAWEVVLTADLLLALGVCLVAMWADAKRRGESPVALSVVTMLTGSVGPLIYLLRRPQDA